MVDNLQDWLVVFPFLKNDSQGPQVGWSHHWNALYCCESVGNEHWPEIVEQFVPPTEIAGKRQICKGFNAKD